ncbi:MAG: hypothetical protein JO147_04590 [Actinobacteria bacterium]|nr:hypothetical protein [Actinomycetota bacterium]
MTSLALATCSAFPHGDDDAALLTTACAKRGFISSWAVWDDPAVDWEAFDVVLIRSTWDYTPRRDRFLAWLDRLNRVRNPAPVVAWSSDKHYVDELVAAGVPVVPTSWPQSKEAEFPSGRFVVKPAVGAGSLGAGRFDSSQPGELDRAREHVERLRAAGRSVMIQPYLDEVDTRGETGLIYLGGRFSHAIGKTAMLREHEIHSLNGASRDLYVAETITPRTASAAELAVSAQALDVVRDRFGDLVYARVDLLPTADGPVVIELELAEPSLFLTTDPSAAERLVDALAASLD